MFNALGARSPYHRSTMSDSDRRFPSGQDQLTATLFGADWQHHAQIDLPPREARLVPLDELRVCDAAKLYLKRKFNRGVYSHQALAAARLEEKEDLLLATGTASGKSACFHLAAFRILDQDADAKIVVAYPLKALAAEQERRWREAMSLAGLELDVGRIDGSVPVREREDILRRSSVVVMTPDVIHAWLLGNLAKRAVARFVAKLRLVIVDELHTYSGVFGSNAAFLFRRLEHAALVLGRRRVQFVSASATVADPAAHAERLFGKNMFVVGGDDDGSPKYPVAIHLLNPSADSDLLAATSGLLKRLVANTAYRFICFIDSRKQVETLASIVGRRDDRAADDDSPVAESEVPFVDESIVGSAEVLPYRSGYEERDRHEIQRRLERGDLRGVISTSALELGIDIQGLDVGVLLGVPQSSTSFLQRIGRIGRAGPGHVFVLNSGTPDDRLVFDEPDGVLQRPLAESKLYLDNPFIRYIHAMCIGRPGGEHDALQALRKADPDAEFSSPVVWPRGFLEMVNNERSGSVPANLQSLKSHAGDNPNHAFPLRDVEPSFKIELRDGPTRHDLGSLSYSQLLREAYPGAVYLHLARGFRVTKVNTFSRNVEVRKERMYFTKPRRIPPQAYPNLDPSSVFKALRFDDLVAYECELQITERVTGFEERRGSTTFSSPYPLSAAKTGVFFDRPMFSRHFFTTGVILAHPALSTEGVDHELLSRLILSAFGLQVPFDANDISITKDQLRVSHSEIERGSPLIVVYDQTYGSLRLSARLLEEDVLPNTFAAARRLVEYTAEDARLAVDESKLNALRVVLAELHRAALVEPVGIGSVNGRPEVASGAIRVIHPGSSGLAMLKDNVEYRVDAVYFNPAKASLAYRGRLSTDGRFESHTSILGINEVAPIPGVSVMGHYDVETGEITPEEGGEAAEAASEPLLTS